MFYFLSTGLNAHSLCGIDMECVQIGERIFFIEGENKGRYPYSNSVFIDDDVKALIDTGIGRDLVTNIARRKKVDYIIYSHGHEDHIAGNYIFKDATVCSHKLDAPAVRSVENLAQLYAPKGTNAERLANLFLREQFQLRDSKVDLEFQEGHVFHQGSIELEVIHTPGHSRGHCCFSFSREKLVFLGDIDVSSFGPWYGGLDSDIDQFIESIRKITVLKFEVAVSSHKGIIYGCKTIEKKLNDYLSRIFEREDKILEFLGKERRLDEIVNRAIIYGYFPEPKDMFRLCEKIMIEKHLQRLIKEGLIERTDIGFKEK